MTPEQWRKAKDIFDQALDKDPAARPRFVSEICGADDALRLEVLALLDNFRAEDSLFERPLVESRPDVWEGRRAGPYRVIRRLARGGMGAVYLGTRDDGEFRRQVAIKIVRPDFEDPELARRFDNERRTLAVLDHPNIVKLLDGGVTEEGAPYLVMDYVEGMPIDKFCDSRNLGVAERLGLFASVCDAVHYAHQNLVVHRDLKPANILVTPEGQPKLLDFGIAKLLRPEYGGAAAGMTRTMLAPMTPEYASPEQLRGEPVTTATDVYSLGVLLYQLLTRSHPYSATARTFKEMERAACEQEPPRPSSAAAGLNPDLDSIVLMAMRKEPQRRYLSAREFAEDVRRHLVNQPVIARPPTIRYKLGRFIRRNRAAAAAGAVAIVTLCASAVVSARYASRAERRFGEVRSLARFVLLDLDQAMQTGLTSARAAVVKQALSYLDSLRGEAAGDEGLARELIDGYLKVGDLQGNFYGPSLGDVKGARESYERALALARGIGSSAYAARCEFRLARIDAASGKAPQAIPVYQRAIAEFERGGDAARADLLEAWDKLAMAKRDMGDIAGARSGLERALRLADELAESRAGASNTQARARAHEQLGILLTRNGAAAEGFAHWKQALDLYAAAASRSPSIPLRRDFAASRINLAVEQARASLMEESLANFRQGLALIEPLTDIDPANRQLRRDRFLATFYLARALAQSGRGGEAAPYFKKALDLSGAEAGQPGASADDHRVFAWLILDSPEASTRAPEALIHARRALEMTGGADPDALATVARAQSAAGDRKGAVDSVRRALSMLPPGESHHRTELEDMLRYFSASK